MLQLSTSCVLEFLPLYTPTAEERADPKLYCANVRAHMLERLRETT